MYTAQNTCIRIEDGESMNDDEIVRLFTQRSEQALSAASAKYTGYCKTVASAILNNTEDVEDCVNDTLLRAWESIPPHCPKNLRGFLGKLTRNCALDIRRRYMADKRGCGETPLVYEELSEIISDTDSVEQSFEYNELVDTINTFLRSLPDIKRRIFVLRYSRFESTPQIAKRVGVSENYVLVSLARVRNKLKKHLEKRGYII